MDRLINVKVSGNHLTKDGNRAGVQGEGNVTTLRLTFDAGWDGLAKHLTWWDAYGEHPVKVILGADLLEDLAEDTRTYRCLIPPEPLAVDGWCSFVIDGYVGDKRQRTVEDKLTVLPAGSAEDAPAPSDPTAAPYEQLQVQIENLLGGMQEAARESKEAQIAIENMSVTAEHVPHDSGLPALERDVNTDGSVALHFNILRPQNNVYVGDGPMPEGYNVQLDPNGEGYDLRDLTAEVLQEAKGSGLFDGPQGPEGPVGPAGPPGKDGKDGKDGEMTFEELTEEQRESLRGPKGDKGDKGDPGKDGTMSFEELTEAQRESLRGEKGDTGDAGPKGDPGDPGVYVGGGEMPAGYYVQIDPNGEGVDLEALIRAAVDEALAEAVLGRKVTVSLPAAAWVADPDRDNLWRQVVQIDGVTDHSQINLTLSDEQVADFYDLSLAFTTNNKDGVVTVSAIGDKPTADYTLQATIKEVAI